MPTYNLTKGALAIAGIDHGKFFVAHIPVVVADIIAGNATLTANAAIAAGDIIQIWDIPADTVLLGHAVLETVVAGQASNTADVGIAGGDEMFDGVALDAAVGTLQASLVGDDWGPDNVTCKTFTATDTLDVKFVAEATSGSHILHVPGYKLFD
jgi:hypothetical protein